MALKIGDKVVISPTSYFYGQRPTQLPPGVIGTVTNSRKDNTYPIRVEWYQNDFTSAKSNVYDEEDLLLATTEEEDITKWL